MSSCCRAGPCQEVFSSGTARRDLDEFRRHGLGSLGRALVNAVTTAVPLAGARVLDIGGGIGAVQAELLRSGAATGEVIELVAEYEPFARRLAGEIGISDRTRWRAHDLLADPTAVEPAEVVVLNRVVCCSADGPALAAAAASLTRGALALSYPNPTRLTRFLAAAQRAAFRLLGRRYRAFVWSEEELLAAAASRGLRVATRGGRSWWRYVVMVRPGSS